MRKRIQQKQKSKKFTLIIRNKKEINLVQRTMKVWWYALLRHYLPLFYVYTQRSSIILDINLASALPLKLFLQKKYTVILSDLLNSEETWNCSTQRINICLLQRLRRIPSCAARSLFLYGFIGDHYLFKFGLSSLCSN